MKNFEACKNLRVILGRARAAIPELENRRDSAINAQPEFDSQAIRSAALESRDAEKKKGAAAENKELISQLQAEIKAAKEKILIIETELKSLESAAVKDVREKYFPVFERAVRDFFSAASKAAELERKIEEIKDAAQKEIGEACSFPFEVLPILGRILTVSGPMENSPLSFFKADCKAEGIDLG